MVLMKQQIWVTRIMMMIIPLKMFSIKNLLSGESLRVIEVNGDMGK